MLLSSGHELSAVASLMRLLDLARCPIPERGMQIPRVVPFDPSGERLFQCHRTGPFAEPEEFFFERPHQPFGLGVALGVVVARERLRDPERRTRFHESHRGRLTAIVAHQKEAVVAAPLRELALHGRVQRAQPLQRLRLVALVVVHDLLRVPNKARTR